MPKAAVKKVVKKSKYKFHRTTDALVELTTSPDRGDEALQPTTDAMPIAFV